MVCTVFFILGFKIVAGGLTLFKYSWAIGLQIVLLGMHGVHCQFYLPWEVLVRCSRFFEIIQIFLINWITDYFVTHASCAILFYSWWNFKHVQILVINWIADCFVRYTHCALSVLIWMESSCSMPMGFKPWLNISFHWIAVCFVSHAWCALFVFFFDIQFFAQGSWNFELV